MSTLTGGDENIWVSSHISEMLGDLVQQSQQVVKTLISFFQVNTSFLSVFPTIVVSWPLSFKSFLAPLVALLEPVSFIIDAFT